VQANFLADDAQAETVDRFFEVYLLWLFGFVLFCSSQGDAVARYLIPHTQRIADTPLDDVPRISWGNSVLAGTYRGLCSGVLKDHSSRRSLSASSPSLALVPLAVYDWSASRLPPRIRGPARGSRPPATVSPWARCGASGQ
jgi:hypothetical protein